MRFSNGYKVDLEAKHGWASMLGRRLEISTKPDKTFVCGVPFVFEDDGKDKGQSGKRVLAQILCLIFVS